MSTARATVMKILTQLPEGATLEDVQYHLYARQKIEHGLADVRKGRIHTQRAVEQRLKKWRKG